MERELPELVLLQEQLPAQLLLSLLVELREPLGLALLQRELPLSGPGPLKLPLLAQRERERA